MISLPEQLYNKLKDEKNASALISKLLDDYYFINDDKIIEQVKEKIAQKDKIKEWYDDFRKKFPDVKSMEAWVQGCSWSMQDKFKQAKESGYVVD